MYIYSHNNRSKGARQLANGLFSVLINHKASRFRGYKSKTVINWGSSELPREVNKCNVINRPDAVARSVNKLSCFEMLSAFGVRVPTYTKEIDIAYGWIDRGYEVLCRTILNGSGGSGITIAKTKEQIVEAPLYVMYVPKKDEYRIHCSLTSDKKFPVHLFYVQRKYKNPNAEHNNVKIRNLEGGYLYENGDVRPPYDVYSQASRAFAASSLDFGAVDVIWSEKKQEAYVLEINTAPGLEGRTLQEYINLFNEMKLLNFWYTRYIIYGIP